MSNHQRVVLPPFSISNFTTERRHLLSIVLNNPHPTDLLLDTSVFSVGRLDLVREILISFSPILLPPIRKELEDLKVKPALAELRNLVFPSGSLNSRFREDDHGVLKSYPRFSHRYANLLRWRRDMIDKEVNRIMTSLDFRVKG
jgi:hypothetical protein